MIIDEDFEYFSENEYEENSENDKFDNTSEEKIEENALIDENNKLKFCLPKGNKEIGKSKNINNLIGNNFLKNKNDYNKDKWKQINQEIPVLSMRKKTSKNKTIEFDIDNKFISGDGELSLKDVPEKSILETLIFNIKNF